MREMLIVILNECEGSIPVVRKSVKCHPEQERRRLSDYLLLHKVFNTKRYLKSKIKKESIFVGQRNSAGKNRVWVSPFIQKKGSEPFLRERSDTIKAFETPYLDERSGKV